MDIEDSKPIDCYCSERSNPKLIDSFADIPDGYCGFCDVCGKPGHTRAHPRSPTTGAWCDEHYDDLISYRAFTLNDIIPILFMVIFVGILITVGMSLYSYLGE